MVVTHTNHLLVRYVLACLVFVMPGFGVENAEADRPTVIEMERYSVKSSLDKKWKKRTIQEPQVIEFSKDKRKGGRIIGVNRIVVIERNASRGYKGTHSEQWIADDARRAEEATMIAQGVMKGVFRLEDVEKTEIDLNDKHLYTMTYKNITDSLIVHGYFYLYFPPGFKNSQMYYQFHYATGIPPSEPQDVDLSEFHSVVDGFEIKEK